jgi:hypothetical protein
MSECKTCHNDTDPITLEEIVNIDEAIFTFEEDGKCYCFVVANLYRIVYVTLDPISEEDAVRDARKPYNPYTRVKIPADTLIRLTNQYASWLETQDEEELSYDGIEFTITDKELVMRELDSKMDRSQEMGYDMTYQEASNSFIEEVEEDDFLYEEDEKPMLIAVAKYIVNDRRSEGGRPNSDSYISKDLDQVAYSYLTVDQADERTQVDIKRY